jgi:hypothetical protein
MQNLDIMNPLWNSRRRKLVVLVGIIVCGVLIALRYTNVQ